MAEIIYGQVPHCNSSNFFQAKILQTRKLKEFAVTPSWTPPPQPLWKELMRQHRDVKFEECHNRMGEPFKLSTM